MDELSEHSDKSRTDLRQTLTTYQKESTLSFDPAIFFINQNLQHKCLINIGFHEHLRYLSMIIFAFRNVLFTVKEKSSRIESICKTGE